MPPSLKISVIVPTFNAGPYIAQTLSSIERQNYPNTEVIVVDGGSKDDTVEVARRFERIVTTLISERDQGQLDAVQKGVALATGDVLVWINGDDIVMPGSFHAVAKAFAQDPKADFVFSDNFAFDPDRRGLYVGPTIRGLNYLDHVLYYRQLYSECVYWKRDINRFLPDSQFDLRVYTDYAFFLNLRAGRTGKWLKKRLGAFRIRSDQASKTNVERKLYEYNRIRSDHLRGRGIGPVRARLMRVAYGPWFFPRQYLYPRLNSLTRKLCRMIDRDRTRNKVAAFFYDQWLGEKAKD